MDVEDKRKFNRFRFFKPIEAYPVLPTYQAKLADEGKSFLTGRMFDLSEGGLGLSMDTHLLAGSLLRFRFDLEQNQPVEVFGKIIWSRDGVCGAKFYSYSGIPPRIIKNYLATLSTS